MKLIVFTVSILIFIGVIMGCQREDHDISIVGAVTDWRDKYTGDYSFNVMELYLGPLDSIYWYTDTVLYEYHGSIEKYDSNRLLIKYSPKPPIAWCCQGQDWCSGGLNDICIIECPPECIRFVEHWISPIIFLNDSLLLFSDYSRLNGSGSISGDSITFFLHDYEQMYGYEIYIQGTR